MFSVDNVARYASHQASDHTYVAFVSRNEESEYDTLRIAILGRAKVGWGNRGTFEGDTIKELHWAQDASVLTFRDNTVIAEKNGKPLVSSALYTWHDEPERSRQRIFTRVNNPH